MFLYWNKIVLFDLMFLYQTKVFLLCIRCFCFIKAFNKIGNIFKITTELYLATDAGDFFIFKNRCTELCTNSFCVRVHAHDLIHDHVHVSCSYWCSYLCSCSFSCSFSYYKLITQYFRYKIKTNIGWIWSYKSSVGQSYSYKVTPLRN